MTDELRLDETIARSSPGGVVDFSTFEALEEALDKADAPITEGGRFLTLVERINTLAARTEGRDSRPSGGAWRPDLDAVAREVNPTAWQLHDEIQRVSQRSDQPRDFATMKAHCAAQIATSRERAARILSLAPSQGAEAADRLGAWMSAALDDPKVCDAMKADIQAWFDAGQPVPVSTPRSAPMHDQICPMTMDGLHQKQVWQERHTQRSGLACKACHKTWEHIRNYGLQPTYREKTHGG